MGFLMFVICSDSTITLIPPHKNPPTAKCFPKKYTNCKMLVPTSHQLRNAFSEKIRQLQSILTTVRGFPEQALCSWLVIGTSTLQLVDSPNKHSSVSRFSE